MSVCPAPRSYVAVRGVDAYKAIMSDRRLLLIEGTAGQPHRVLMIPRCTECNGAGHHGTDAFGELIDCGKCRGGW